MIVVTQIIRKGNFFVFREKTTFEQFNHVVEYVNHVLHQNPDYIFIGETKHNKIKNWFLTKYENNDPVIERIEETQSARLILGYPGIKKNEMLIAWKTSLGYIFEILKTKVVIKVEE